jgi:predicted nucleic acid-binding protein
LTIADTDVLVDYLSGVNPSADRVAAELDHGSLATTAITRFELLCDARDPRQQAKIRELLTLIPTLLFDAAADRAEIGASSNVWPDFGSRL